MPKPLAKHEIRVWLDQETYTRVTQEALARGVNFSQLVRRCLQDYFALRDELASSIEIEPTGAQRPTAPRIIHALLAQTEHRLRADLERRGQQLSGVLQALRRLETMLDELYLGMMVHLPESPSDRAPQHLEEAERRHALWRQAVEQAEEEIAARKQAGPEGDPEADLHLL